MNMRIHCRLRSSAAEPLLATGADHELAFWHFSAELRPGRGTCLVRRRFRFAVIVGELVGIL